MEDQQQPEVVIEDPRIESVSGMMYDQMPYEEGPQFRISEVAKTFFGRTPHWLRWLHAKEALFLDGRPVGQRMTSQNSRIYGLRDIEEIAHGLAQQRRLEGTNLRLALLILDSVGRLHGVREVDWGAIERDAVREDETKERQAQG